MPKRVITANRSTDGAVVWRDAAGAWDNNVNRAMASEDERTVGRMLAAARVDEAAGIVIAPYEVEVAQTDVSLIVVPVELREQIRAAGPTVALN